MISCCKNAVSDFGSIKIAIDKEPYYEIAYGTGDHELNLPKGRLYTPPYSFFPFNGSIIIYDGFLKKIYEVKGDIILKCPMFIPVIDFTLHKDNFYIFDSKNISLFDLNECKVVKNIPLNLPSDIKSIGKSSFFFNNFLFIGDFSKENLNTQIAFIYDLERNKLSRRIETDELFIPLTNCKKAEISKLKKLLFSNGNAKYLGQTGHHVFYCLFGNQGELVNYYVYYKNSAKTEVVKTAFEKYSIDLLPMKPLMFLDDSTGVFQTLKWEKGYPDKLLYYRFRIITSN
jgi:hypothetical protein